MLIDVSFSESTDNFFPCFQQLEEKLFSDLCPNLNLAHLSIKYSIKQTISKVKSEIWNLTGAATTKVYTSIIMNGM